MHLYIDTFITDEPLRLTAKNLENINQLNNLRKMSAPYQWRPKIDIKNLAKEMVEREMALLS